MEKGMCADKDSVHTKLTPVCVFKLETTPVSNFDEISNVLVIYKYS